VVLLHAAPFAGGPSVAAKVEYIHARELVDQREPEPIGGVTVDVTAVGDVGDDAGTSDAVGRPPDRSDVAVVEVVLVRCRGARRVRVANVFVERRVAVVLVVVVAGSLTFRVRRVAD